MNRLYPILFFLLLIQNVFAQSDSRLALAGTAETMRKVKAGSYKITVAQKALMKPDTTSDARIVFFEMLSSDTLIGAKCRIENGNTVSIYNGKELFRLNKSDSSYSLLSMFNPKNYREFTGQDWLLYDYFGKGNYFEKILNDATVEYALEKNATINGIDCKVISVKLKLENRAEFTMIKNQQTIYVDNATQLLVRISEEKHIMFQNKIMKSYSSITLDDFIINPVFSSTTFNYPQELNLQPKKITDSLLMVNAIAPDFNFNSINNSRVSLADLKGKIVLLCFWYMDNYDCLKSLSIVNGLQNTYKNNGLVVIGINSKDAASTSSIDTLLNKRKITFENIVTEDKSILKNYHVISYPTFYVIDKNGKIVRAIEGYGEYVRPTLEKAIKSQIGK